jgi:hypothetical protein
MVRKFAVGCAMFAVLAAPASGAYAQRPADAGCQRGLANAAVRTTANGAAAKGLARAQANCAARTTPSALRAR